MRYFAQIPHLWAFAQRRYVFAKLRKYEAVLVEHFVGDPSVDNPVCLARSPAWTTTERQIERVALRSTSKRSVVLVERFFAKFGGGAVLGLSVLTFHRACFVAHSPSSLPGSLSLSWGCMPSLPVK